jgi:hypothetical protein
MPIHSKIYHPEQFNEYEEEILAFIKGDKSVEDFDIYPDHNWSTNIKFADSVKLKNQRQLSPLEVRSITVFNIKKPNNC